MKNGALWSAVFVEGLEKHRCAVLISGNGYRPSACESPPWVPTDPRQASRLTTWQPLATPAAVVSAPVVVAMEVAVAVVPSATLAAVLAAASVAAVAAPPALPARALAAAALAALDATAVAPERKLVRRGTKKIILVPDSVNRVLLSARAAGFAGNKALPRTAQLAEGGLQVPDGAVIAR
jgi:hypothetical protein